MFDLIQLKREEEIISNGRALLRLSRFLETVRDYLSFFAGQYNESMVVTGTDSPYTTIRAVGHYYQPDRGKHRLDFNIVVDTTGGIVTAQTFNFAGVVFKNVAGFNQKVDFDNMINSSAIYRAYTNPGTDSISTDFASCTPTRYTISGNVELESKPTTGNGWA